MSMKIVYLKDHNKNKRGDERYEYRIEALKLIRDGIATTAKQFTIITEEEENRQREEAKRKAEEEAKKEAEERRKAEELLKNKEPETSRATSKRASSRSKAVKKST